MLNAYLRLKMHFDNRVLFDIDSKPEDGTDILIQIPLDAVGDAAMADAIMNGEDTEND